MHEHTKNNRTLRSKNVSRQWHSKRFNAARVECIDDSNSFTTATWNMCVAFCFVTLSCRVRRCSGTYGHSTKWQRLMEETGRWREVICREKRRHRTKAWRSLPSKIFHSWLPMNIITIYCYCYYFQANGLFYLPLTLTTRTFPSVFIRCVSIFVVCLRPE